VGRGTITLELVSVGARFFVGFLLVAAAIPKFADRLGFAHALSQYRAIPAGLTKPLSWSVPGAEVVLGGSLLFGVATTQAAGAAAVMFGTFAAAVSVNLIYGERRDCGCGVASDSRPMSWLLVLGDILLCGGCVFVAFFSTSAFALLPVGHAPSGLVDGDALAMSIFAASLLLSMLLAGQSKVWGLSLRAPGRGLR
jgi:uncharacterized membrane protein YphA (DoxX/SURF4 family)